LRQHERRVRHRAAERSGMEIGAAAAKIELKVHEATESVADRWDAAGEHGRIGDDDNVTLEIVFVAADELVQVLAANLLFALEHHLDVDWQPPGCLQMRL